jgi:hypothetical protein
VLKMFGLRPAQVSAVHLGVNPTFRQRLSASGIFSQAPTASASRPSSLARRSLS